MKAALKPNIISIYLTVVFLLPVLVLCLLISSLVNLDLPQTATAATLGLLAALPFTYIASCIFYIVYSKTQNRWLRIMMIVAATAASLGASALMFLLLIQQQMVICDPVHEPPRVCDPVHNPPTTTTTLPITGPTTTTTPGITDHTIICDPVHRPIENANYVGLFAMKPKVSKALRDRLNELHARIENRR